MPLASNVAARNRLSRNARTCGSLVEQGGQALQQAFAQALDAIATQQQVAGPGGAAAAVLDLPTVLVHLVIGQGWTGRTFQAFTQTWSLTSEVTFYLLLPVVAAACAPVVRHEVPAIAARRVLLLCAAIAIAPPSGRTRT